MGYRCGECGSCYHGPRHCVGCGAQNSMGDTCLGLRRERDDARAEIERLRDSLAGERIAHAFWDNDHIEQTLQAAVEKLRSRVAELEKTLRWTDETEAQVKEQRDEALARIAELEKALWMLHAAMDEEMGDPDTLDATKAPRAMRAAARALDGEGK